MVCKLFATKFLKWIFAGLVGKMEWVSRYQNCSVAGKGACWTPTMESLCWRASSQSCGLSLEYWESLSQEDGRRKQSLTQAFHRQMERHNMLSPELAYPVSFICKDTGKLWRVSIFFLSNQNINCTTWSCQYSAFADTQKWQLHHWSNWVRVTNPPSVSAGFSSPPSARAFFLPSKQKPCFPLTLGWKSPIYKWGSWISLIKMKFED